MTNTEIADLMLEDLKKVATLKHKKMGLANFPSTSFLLLGVSSPLLKGIAKEWMTILHGFSPKQWVGLCLILCGKRILECQQLAFEIIWKNKKILKSLTPGEILDLGKDLDNWVSVDSYCTMIAGWHWREGTLPDSQIRSWVKSENHWLRRTAVVCTIPLNLRAKGGAGDTLRTLMVCEQVVNDRHDMVVKALSWALRELSKSDKQAVIEFMNIHRDNLHGRVRREVTAKLETGRKNG